MATQKGGVELSKLLTTLRSPDGDIVISADTSGRTIKQMIGGIVYSSIDAGIRYLKTHTGYAGSGLFEKTFAVTTTDNTATAVATIACPLSSTLGVWARGVGKIVGTSGTGGIFDVYNGVTNAAGTVAVIGTTLPSATGIENASNTPAITIVADDTADTIVVKVTGNNSETWAWTGWIWYMTVTSSS